MARFDVYRARSRSLVIDVQADPHFALPTRVVIPLVPTRSLMPLSDINPVIIIERRSFTLAADLMFSVTNRSLGPPVVNLSEYRDEIIRALDALFIGF